MSRNPQVQRTVGELCRALLICFFVFHSVLVTRAQTNSESVSNAPTHPTKSATNAPHARVVIAEDPDATYDLQPLPDRIQVMVDRSLTNLTGKSSATEAWLSLVKNTDVVGIKVFSAPGPNSGTRPAVVAAVVRGLIAAGIPTNNIIIWDKRGVDLRMAGFTDFEQRFGVKVISSVEAGWDEKIYYEAAFLGPMVFSDLEFNKQGEGVGRKSHVSKLLLNKITKVIAITPLIHHNILGVCGNLYSVALGSVDNSLRFEANEWELNRAVPEIYALPQVGDHVVLNIVDALICQYEGQQYSLLHYSTVLNQLRFSKDPLALDVLSLQEINHQRLLAGTAIMTNLTMFANAQLVEIGVADQNRIDVTRVAPGTNAVPKAPLP